MDETNQTPQPTPQPEATPSYISNPAETLRQKMVSRLPANLQERIPGLQSQANSSLKGAAEFLGPLWTELRTIITGLTRKMATSVPSASVGATFRHLCFVGLNKSELLLAGETTSVFNENWADLTGDNIRRHTALMFFAPRGLDGQPANPYLFLVGEAVPDDEDLVDQNTITLAQQSIGPMALLDLCRTSKSPPNTVNLLLVADTLFHWDVKDNYILPTSPISWVRDVEQVLRSYPRTTKAHLYTQWDTELLPPSERITIHPLREFPLDENTWLNKPTFQERHGNHVLILGLVLAAFVWGGLYLQGRQVDELTDQVNVIEQQIPRQGQFSDLERGIAEQEKMFRTRDLFSLVVKDTARAIEKSGIKITSFEVRVGEPENPPKTYVVTIDAKAEAYQGWLQQEPIARTLLLNSALLDAIRKPPTTTGFKLEALVDANNLYNEYKPLSTRVKVIPKAEDAAAQDTAAAAPTSSSTTSVFGTASKAATSIPVGGKAPVAAPSPAEPKSVEPKAGDEEEGTDQ